MNYTEEFKAKLNRLAEVFEEYVGSIENDGIARELSLLSAEFKNRVKSNQSKQALRDLAYQIKIHLNHESIAVGRGSSSLGNRQLLAECLDLIFIFQEARYADVE